MVKVVIRDATPGVDPGSFAAQPKTFYRLGTRYGRTEEVPDPEHGMHVLIVVSEPDAWMVNLASKTGQHIVDASAPYHHHAPVLAAPDDPEFVKAFEFGCELEYLKQKAADPPQSLDLDGRKLLAYRASEGERTLTLVIDPGTQKPFAATAHKSGKVVAYVRYLEYETGLRPDLSLFAAPTGVKYTEAGGAAPQASYLGQPAPGTKPERFAPGLVSTDAIELNGVFTPDGREFFFTRLVDGADTMHHSAFANGTWSKPRPLLLFPGRARALAADMSVSPDGQQLYFLGQHPHELAPEKPGYDLWVSRRVSGEWTTAQVVPPPVSTAAEELYPVVVADGSLYFSSNRAGGLGRSDVYRAQRLADGRFADPVNIGPPVNSEFGTGDTFVAPDESYLVVSSRRPGGFGNGDLFVSFRQKGGGWGEPVNLGASINTDQHEFCPMVTPDGRYLFFSRRWGATWEETTAGDVYWVDAKVLEQFRR